MILQSEPILYCAPGAGLGHLTRACALACHVPMQIVTSSPFAQGLAQLTGMPIHHIPRQEWNRDIQTFVNAHPWSLVILDAFPRGVLGEWENWKPQEGLAVVYMARRLNLKAYAEAAGQNWNVPLPGMQQVIVAETLSEEHAAMLELWKDTHGIQSHCLPGRICLPETFPAPLVPKELTHRLQNDGATLVVHSGPREECEQLVRQAQMDAQGHGGEVVLLSPWQLQLPNVSTFEYYPAPRLFPLAQRVITGAGYNAIAETAFIQHKHKAVPFPRKFDDQQGRLNDLSSGQGDGTPMAAQMLANWASITISSLT